MEDFHIGGLQAGIYCIRKDGTNLRFQIKAVSDNDVTVKCVKNMFGKVDGKESLYSIKSFQEQFYKDSDQED